MRFYLKILIAFCVILLSIQTCLNGQSDKSNLTLGVDIGANFGGNVSSGNFDFGSGILGEVSIHKKIDESVSIHFGAGIKSFDDSYFYPIYLGVNASIFRNKNFKLMLRAGYSPGEVRNDSKVEGFDLDGGPFIETGRIWNFPVSDKVNLQSTLSFSYQFAVLEFETNEVNYNTKSDYLGFSLKLGVIFK